MYIYYCYMYYMYIYYCYMHYMYMYYCCFSCLLHRSLEWRL